MFHDRLSYYVPLLISCRHVCYVPCHATGMGVAQDMPRAVQLFHAAAAKGSTTVLSYLGMAVPVELIISIMKAPGIMRLKPCYDELLSCLAFNFDVCRYTLALLTVTGMVWQGGSD